ncbi:hypothetical protein [Halopiger xanaduensis]|uniref:Uncharacterized protein n=1 Tax=Halopiger xanaduensis (strain DSM 18323 / JCM 14033 / SH-6) TaxID=797210 RepID=F8DBV4_HALXS|nr:hypothetical protein [Halopiger xanaduensis]AEH35930.1 hypothetical protein Halxa_1297 [Halopiger xanaduensis SH-6]
MGWQDLVFMAGSLLTVAFLVPALRDVTTRIPLVTSVPKAALGAVYAVTFATLGMDLAAVGLVATGVAWSLLAAYRSPRAAIRTPSRGTTQSATVTGTNDPTDAAAQLHRLEE